MNSWFEYFKAGFSRTPAPDQLKGPGDYAAARENLRNLKPFFLRHWREGLFGALLILLTTLLSFPQPLIMRYLVDDVLLAGQLQLLLGAVLLIAGIKLLAMLTGAWRSFYFARFEQKVLLDIQEDLFNHTLRLPKAFLDSQETGYLMSRLMGDVNGLRWFFSSALVSIATSILRFIGGVAFLVYLEWRLAVIVLLALPGLVLAVRLFSRRIRILGHQGMEQRAQVSRAVQETLSTTDLIKAFSSEERTLLGLMGELRSALQIRLEQATVGSAAGMAISLVPEIARAIVLLVGGYWIIQGDWTLGSLLAFQSYMGFVYGPAQYLATANLQLQNALVALERISALYDITPEEDLGRGERVERLRGEVDFKAVSFSYDGQEQVLQDVSFNARPGEVVAIAGPSGVGKTTLLCLILRFYKPTSGEIYFDERPAGAYELGSLRQRIGYVSQSPELLSGSILDNLLYGNPDASDEQAVQAARASGIHDFIAGLPDGYASEVGERGVKLSEGQKQRLSLARALVRDPDILVLDEPTAALDRATERTIFEALPALVKQKTLFIVSHRLSTVEDANCILVLNENRLVASGNHHELLEGSDYYRSLVGG